MHIFSSVWSEIWTLSYRGPDQDQVSSTDLVWFPMPRALGSISQAMCTMPSTCIYFFSVGNVWQNEQICNSPSFQQSANCIPQKTVTVAMTYTGALLTLHRLITTLHGWDILCELNSLSKCNCWQHKQYHILLRNRSLTRTPAQLVTWPHRFDLKSHLPWWFKHWK